MNLKETNVFLGELEKEFDVWSWQFEEMQYWPLLRLYLWRLLVADISATPVTSATDQNKSTKNWNSAPPSAAKVSPEVLYERVSQRFPSQSLVEILFLARDQDCTDYAGGKYHDRIIDPIWRLVQNTDIHVQKICSVRSPDDPQQDNAVPALTFFPDGFGVLDNVPPEVPELAGLIDRVRGGDFQIAVNDPVFRSLLNRTCQRSIAYGALLDAYQPRLVMLGVYYDACQMAAVRACKQRGIPVVDIQHGKQGRYHGAYTDWHNVPEKGNELLPDFFWVWGKPTAARIEQGFGKSISTPCPVVGGNVWLGEWQNGIHNSQPQLESFLKKFRGAEKRIMISLQPIADPLHDTLMEALENSPANWVWWFRLHRKQKNEIIELTNEIEKAGANFAIVEPTALPLYPLLKAADYHLTAWSSVAFEAEALDCPTSLFHPLGQDILQEEIREGRFRFAKNGRQLISQIGMETDNISWVQKMLQWLKYGPNDPYIVSEPEKSLETLRGLLPKSLN